MKTKDILLASTGVIISFILIYLSFRNADFPKFLAILKTSNYSFMLLFLISTFFELFFRTLKWYFILKPNGNINLKELFKIEVIGLGINNILPFRIGEITKIFLVSHFYNLPKTTALSTVFIERLMDTLILFALLLIYSKLGKINILINQTYFFIILNIIIIIVILLFIFSDKILLNKKFKYMEKSHPKIHSFIIKIKNGGACFKNIWLTLLMLLSGLIQWNFDVLNNFFIARALKIYTIDYFKAAITVFAGSLSASIPSMPGYFGNYEYAVSRVCMSWNIDRETSLLFATSVHLLGYIAITLTAIVFIYSMGLNFKKILSLPEKRK